MEEQYAVALIVRGDWIFDNPPLYFKTLEEAMERLAFCVYKSPNLMFTVLKMYSKKITT